MCCSVKICDACIMKNFRCGLHAGSCVEIKEIKYCKASAAENEAYAPFAEHSAAGFRLPLIRLGLL